MNTTACALVLSVGGLSFSSEAWSFTQPNSVSPAYIAGLNSQAAAGRAASAVTVAPKVAVVASGPSAAAKAASLVTIAAPAVTTAITSQALAGKAASLVTIGAPAITTAITSQALAGKAASQVTFASPATKIAQNIAAATPKGLLTPGKATPDYGPYDDSGTSTPNPYASLTDLQPANDQTFSNPSFAQGLTNLNFNQLAAANADPKNAIAVDPTNPPKSMTPAPNSSASSKLGAAGAAAGGAITDANGQTGAGSSGTAINATAGNAALLGLLGGKIGSAVGSGAGTIAGPGSSGGYPAPSWVAAVTGNSPITSDVPPTIGQPIDLKGAMQQGQITVVNLAQIQNSIPPQFQLGLPASVTLTASDRAIWQDTAGDWLKLGTVAAGGVLLNGIRTGAGIVEAAGGASTGGGLNLGLGGGGGGLLGGSQTAVTTTTTAAAGTAAWANMQLGQAWHAVQGTLPQGVAGSPPP